MSTPAFQLVPRKGLVQRDEMAELWLAQLRMQGGKRRGTHAHIAIIGQGLLGVTTLQIVIEWSAAGFRYVGFRQPKSRPVPVAGEPQLDQKRGHLVLELVCSGRRNRANLGTLVVEPLGSSFARSDRTTPRTVGTVKIAQTLPQGIIGSGLRIAAKWSRSRARTKTGRVKPRVVELTERDKEILLYLHEQWFLTEQTIIKLWWRNFQPVDGSSDGAKFNRSTRRWECQATRRRLRYLRQARMIRHADPDRAASPKQRANWAQWWHERPYLLDTKGRAWLLEAGKITHTLPSKVTIRRYKKQGQPAPLKPIDSPVYIHTHGSNNVVHSQTLAQLRFLLEQVAKQHDLQGFQRGWISERQLYYEPRWPIFHPSRRGRLRRPRGRLPDAIITWNEASWALELEISSNAASPKSCLRYKDILEDYTRLISYNWLDLVLYVFDDKTAAKRFLKRYLPQIVARYPQRFTPDYFLTTTLDQLRGALITSLRKGVRIPIPVYHRHYHQDRRQWTAVLPRDMHELSNFRSIDAPPPDSVSNPDWARIYVANTPATAAATAEALVEERFDTIKEWRVKAATDPDWYRGDHPGKHLVIGLPPGEPIRLSGTVRGHPGILMIEVLSASDDHWTSRRYKEAPYNSRYHHAHHAYIHEAYVRRRPDWRGEYDWMRDGSLLSQGEVEPNAELSDASYRSWQNRFQGPLMPTGSSTVVPCYYDIDTFKRILRCPELEPAERDAGRIRDLPTGTRIHRTAGPETLQVQRKRYTLWRFLPVDEDLRWWARAEHMEPADLGGWWLVNRDDGEKS